MERKSLGFDGLDDLDDEERQTKNADVGMDVGQQKSKLIH